MNFIYFIKKSKPNSEAQFNIGRTIGEIHHVFNILCINNIVETNIFDFLVSRGFSGNLYFLRTSSLMASLLTPGIKWVANLIISVYMMPSTLGGFSNFGLKMTWKTIANLFFTSCACPLKILNL